MVGDPEEFENEAVSGQEPEECHYPDPKWHIQLVVDSDEQNASFPTGSIIFGVFAYDEHPEKEIVLDNDSFDEEVAQWLCDRLNLADQLEKETKDR